MTLYRSLLFIASITMAGPALAQETDPPAPVTISGGVTAVSDYRWRGVSLSNEDLAIQPSITIEHESGLYGTLWGSNIDDTPVYGDVEVDFYAGYAREVAPGLTLDAGVAYYWYPDGQGDSDFFEPYASLAGTLGPAEAKVGMAYAWNQAALGDEDNLYLFGDLAVGVPTTPVTLNAHLGHSTGSLGYRSGGYWDWSVGADMAVSMFTLGVRYVDSDLDRLTGVPAADTLYDAAVLFSIGVNF